MTSLGRRLYHVPSADWTPADALRALGRSRAPGAVAAVEASAERLLGVPVIAFGSCRAALAAVLLVLDPPPERVWVPGFTCVAVPNAVEASGRRPSWVDVDGPNLDPAALAAVAAPGDVVIAQHTYGVPIAPGALRHAADAGVRVVEDRAHRLDGEDLVGIAAVFSLEHSKVVSAGAGGLAWAADEALRERLRLLRDGLPVASGREIDRTLRTSAVQTLLARLGRLEPAASLVRRIALRIPAVSQVAQTDLELAGGGVRLVRMHPRAATLGATAVARAPATLAHRRGIARIYRERLGDLVPPWATADRPYVRQPVVVADAARTAAALRAEGFDLGPRWFEAPVHPAGSRSSYAGEAPRGEALARRVLSLPTHPLIDADAAAAIAAAVTRHA